MAINFSITVGQQSVQFEVPTEKQTQFQEAILAAVPKEGFEGTDLQWLGQIMQTYIKDRYKRGLQILLEQSLLNVDDIIPQPSDRDDAEQN